MSENLKSSNLSNEKFNYKKKKLRCIQITEESSEIFKKVKCQKIIECDHKKLISHKIFNKKVKYKKLISPEIFDKK